MLSSIEKTSYILGRMVSPVLESKCHMNERTKVQNPRRYLARKIYAHVYVREST